MSNEHHAPSFDPSTGPDPDTTQMSGGQLIALMGGALLLALIFLDIVSR